MIISEGLKPIIFFGMIGYMSIVIIVGIYYSKKNKTSEQFFLGGRSLGPWMTALSAEASDMSSWLLMGLPGLAYLTGLSLAFYTALGLILGTWANWFFVAKRLRIYSHLLDSITLPEYFSKRFNDKKKILSIISSLIIFIFFIVYTSSGFAALGKLFESLFNLDYITMMIVSAIIVVLYTMLGGFLAESTCDFMQGILMILSLIIVLLVAFSQASGFEATFEFLKSKPNFLSFSKTGENPVSFLSILSLLAWGLGYFGMPHVLLRFMAIDDANNLKKSRKIAMIWIIISLFAALLIGLVGYAALPNYLENLDGLSASSKSETIFIALTTLIADKYPYLAIFVGIILSGILAATMSTSDSQLLITSSVVTENIHKGIINPKVKDRNLLLISRITIIIVAALAAIIARKKDSSVFSIVSYAWAGFGASFGPVILFSLFSKKINLNGAIAGMISGFISVILYKNIISKLSPILNIYELLPSFIISSICIIIFSRFGKKIEDSTFNKMIKILNEEKK